MVVIEKYTALRVNDVAKLSVMPEQQQFTAANVPQRIAELNSQQHPHVIIADSQVVGFFILDLGFSTNNDFSPERALGIRSLLIDQGHQGKGFAQQALLQLPSYAQQAYSSFESLYLTVNCRNKPAYNCYVKCGFVDHGNLHLGGPVGPQHILSFKLG
ncbi:GNAT family N-acetyltransferase [Alginatibacterium sediminis]|uniref:GNAT family N-acetyltransferase n=1 Tax=Alginatibacterium sediminis TaxID=2164068 RepID=A0A420EBH3_9ALTE|nr:GNAT family N-acetyltransferase [Alginatibacterium sediminis]RKF18040.1 GNAT family N-acetyltransferase [Alginatibacterium sediminis]